MSQLLQPHPNRRLIMNQSAASGPTSPELVGTVDPLSPMSIGPSSPQGMPIPRKLGNQENAHWILLNQPNNPNAFGAVNLGMQMEPLEAPSAVISEAERMSMEGGISKLCMGLDDDEMFKQPKEEILGPTLAELNPPDADTLLDGLTFDDLYWPSETAHMDPTPSPQAPPMSHMEPDRDFIPFQIQPLPQLGAQKILVGLETNVPSQTQILNPPQTFQPATFGLKEEHVPVLQHPRSPTVPQPSSGTTAGLRELLLRKELQNSMESTDAANSQMGQSLPRAMLVPSPNPSQSSPRLSSSAPTSQGPMAWENWRQKKNEATVWERREPRPHVLSTSSLAEAGSTSSLSAAEILINAGSGLSMSMEEGLDSDESDRDSSDDDSDVSDTESTAGSTGGSRKERFFWQYNVQAKGPKGQRLVVAPTQEDPHVLQKPQDPVFSPLCHIQGIKHSGKARKGDGNDLTPSPRKLCSIGKELERLNKVITDMAPVSELPTFVKSKTRKEKNKLASRACRLKKKAQHEANKLKLYGLEQEHKRLMGAIQQSREIVFAKMDGTLDPPDSMTMKLERISRSASGAKVAGHTTDFVNKVIDRVKLGDPEGGINDL